MKSIFKLYILFLVCLLINSCQKEFSISDEIPISPVLDTDAKKFLDIAGIADSSVKDAVYDLVKQLKDSSLWNKFLAIYPMVGGTYGSTKWNLKDPRDLDAAFRLSFNGSPVFASTGVLFPTNNDYADTHLIDSILIYNDNSISYFSRTENKVNGFDMGCDDTTAPYNQISIYHEFSGTAYFGFAFWAHTPPSTIGLFMVSATALNVVWYENGIPKLQKDSPPNRSFTNSPFLIGFCKNSFSNGQRECSFATIGKGLNDSDALKFSNIVNEFNHRLNR